eukprot:TRINITY_DN11455_c0_g1_i1.p1 TRINITY_DN11455_c0_g1~~TRINITY_DN11455_c0_g1_i1.p1  ORF type:complete len:980 (+),score=284.95 TRINITY_DN11455_c0_g1_i1:32-2941(+)
MAIHDQVVQLLEAALANEPSVISHASELVKLLKTECEGYNDDQQTNIRTCLTSLVGNARTVSTATAPMERCLALGQLASSCSGLEQALQDLQGQDPVGIGLPETINPPVARSMSGASIASSASPTFQNPPLVDSDSSDDDDTELYNNMEEHYDTTAEQELDNQISLPSDLQDVYDIVNRDVSELFKAIDRWEVADVVCMTTGIIRALPTLLQVADEPDTLPAVLEAQKTVIGNCGQLTHCARTIAQAPNDKANAGMIRSALVDLSASITAFADAIKNQIKAKQTEQDEQAAIAAARAMFARSQALLASKKEPAPANPSVDVARLNRVMSMSERAVTFAVRQLLTCLYNATTGVKELAALTDQLVIHTCNLLDCRDELMARDIGSLRNLCYQHALAAVGSLEPLCCADGLDLTTRQSLASTAQEAVQPFHDAVASLVEACLAEVSKPSLAADKEVAATAPIVPGADVQVSCKLCSSTVCDSTGKALRLGQPLVGMVKLNETIAQLKASLATQCDMTKPQMALLSMEAILTDDTLITEELANSMLYLFNQQDGLDLQHELDMIQERAIAKRLHNNKAVSSPQVQRQGTKKYGDLQGRSAEETARMQLMALVKDGRLTIEEAVSAGKVTKSSAMQLALKVQNRAEDGVHTQPGIPLVSGVTPDPDAMSMAAFAATTVSRKFRKSRRSVKKSPKFIMEGFLHKEGGKMKNWRARWFVLTDKELTYFKSASVREPAGVIALDLCVSCEVAEDRAGHEHCIQINPKPDTDRIYFLSAANKTQQRAWQRTIDSLIDGRRSYEDKLQVLHSCLLKLEETCTVKEGAFRTPGSAPQVAKLLQALHTTKDMPEELLNNPSTTVSFIKACFKNGVVGPLLTQEDEQLLQAALIEHKTNEEAQMQVVANALELIHPVEAAFVRHLVQVLSHALEHEHVTQTSVEDLSRSFGSLLLPTMDEAHARNTIALMLIHAEELFFSA